MKIDVIIAGGGPAGLSAALALGRGCKRVLLADGGPRRNAAATHMHNFISRDGTPPAELRRIAEEQLREYPNVEVRHEAITAIRGEIGDFVVELPSGEVRARRVLLCTGLVDELLDIEGFRALWGHSIFQCPYCHGWEVKGRRWGYLARDAESLSFAIKLRAWTRDVIAFTNGAFAVPDAVRAKLAAAGVGLEVRPVRALASSPEGLTHLALTDGDRVACEILFTHPRQRQVEIVRALGVAVDDDGLVRIDPSTRETSIRGIYASGDLTSRVQGAIFAAAAGAQAAASINAELTAELAARGEL